MNQQVDNELGGYKESAAVTSDRGQPASAVGGALRLNASDVAAPAYTTESDIEAMAKGIADALPDTWRHEALVELCMIAAHAALAASPVHAELEGVRAENERMRLALSDVRDNMGDDAGDVCDESWAQCWDIIEQALQQKGGSDE